MFPDIRIGHCGNPTLGHRGMVQLNNFEDVQGNFCDLVNVGLDGSYISVEYLKVYLDDISRPQKEVFRTRILKKQ